MSLTPRLWNQAPNRDWVTLLVQILRAGLMPGNTGQVRHLDSPVGVMLSESAAGPVYRIGVHPRP